VFVSACVYTDIHTYKHMKVFFLSGLLENYSVYVKGFLLTCLLEYLCVQMASLLWPYIYAHELCVCVCLSNMCLCGV
jgi:hypothetical protein